MYEGYIIVDFVPTSENISTWLLGIIAKKMSRSRSAEVLARRIFGNTKK